MKFVTWNVFDAWNYDIRFGDPYGVFQTFSMGTTLSLYIGWHVWRCPFYVLKTFRKHKKAKPCKKLRKIYFLEWARIRQETMERLGINHNEDTWISGMRFWWPPMVHFVSFMKLNPDFQRLQEAKPCKSIWFLYGFWGMRKFCEIRWNRMTFDRRYLDWETSD